ncbi:MAG: M3 family metallopeptidase [Acidobacteriota bacterium]|nr:M3 family metallopeptidase [Acidobacteriota bacterium]
MSAKVEDLRVGTAGLSAENPFFLVSALPWQAPAFDKIKNSDYLPAIEAGMAEQRREVGAIVEKGEAASFANTLVALEKTGTLLQRAMAAFNLMTGANTNPELERIERELAPRLAAHHDAIFLDGKLFARVAALYEQREAAGLSGEELRLVEFYYQRFVHAGAALGDSDKEKLKKLNEEESALSNEFRSKVLAGTKAAAYLATDVRALDGLSEAQRSAAADAAKLRGKEGGLLSLQNTTQQPSLSVLRVRGTRQAVFEHSLTRTERRDANDTRATVARLAQLRAEKAAVLGFGSYAAWKLEDQMAKTPEKAAAFLDGMVEAAIEKVQREAAEIQAVIDAGGGGFALEPWDWEFYSEQVRRAKYDLDEEELRPYFETDRVLRDGVFYAASQVYGLSFTERKDIPVWCEDVRVFEIADGDGEPLTLFYFDPFKRDNKNGGAWMSSFVRQSKLMGARPVIYNVSNLPKPAEGEPALIGLGDVITLFHEFGHALHGMFSDCEFPSLSGTSVARDFVEFPSQFNERWATWPAIFDNYARHYRTGKGMSAELAEKIRRAEDFNRGYKEAELLAAAQLDMEWHTLSPEMPLQDTEVFEGAVLEKKGLALRFVPPRYRSSFFSHIWGGGYAAGYYAYIWSQRLEADAFRWFEEHGGLTRENGDRLRRMVLSRGNTEDLATIFAAWVGGGPN